MTIEMTAAKIGRRMKRFPICSALGVYLFFRTRLVERVCTSAHCPTFTFAVVSPDCLSVDILAAVVRRRTARARPDPP